jgi:hypothetical protein
VTLIGTWRLKDTLQVRKLVLSAPYNNTWLTLHEKKV